MSTTLVSDLDLALNARNDGEGRHQNPDFIRSTFASIASRYDLANHALSFGVDFWWRARAAVIVRNWRSRRILDLATGSGDLAACISRACPQAEIIGADFCESMLRESRKKGSWPLVVADGLSLPFKDRWFDVVTVAFGLRNMASREGALREMARVLRRNGHLLVMDFSLPTLPGLRQGYQAYLHRVLPKVAGSLTGNASAYEYLGESIEKFPHGEAMCRMIERCGFVHGRSIPLTLGIVSLYTAERRDRTPPDAENERRGDY